jgi:hypothetical protein
MIELPDMHQATLDDATLSELIADVEQLGSDVEVIQKAAARELVNATPLTSAEARAQLAAGRIRAFQLRYDYDGARWCDTLTRFQTGYRLTRISLLAAATKA